MKVSTYFALLAEFGTVHIPIIEVGRKYFGYDERKSKSEAARAGYPFPVFRSGGQKSQWLVDATDLASYLDEVREKAEKEWKLAKSAR